mmetsp:Transcript_17265/g.33913  ORF Transcript_17265/g.33913 Transcript_17265/m.33913 type:complete len:704 (-) Transcript_17265:124-2235(-)
MLASRGALLAGRRLANRRSVAAVARSGAAYWQDAALVQSTKLVQNNNFSSFNETRKFSSEASSSGEKHEFKAETSKLLDIVTNSIYTEKEIFLRELVSNAADALEKLRHLQASGDEKVQVSDGELRIELTTDKDAGTLTIRDNGVGMTKEEMLENLGTIARSGSKAFVEAHGTDDVSKNVIGQFGVGFYSGFMVGKEVEVYSRSSLHGPEEVGHVWKSKGSDDFSIRPVGQDELEGFGTKIVIHLKEEQKAEYTDSDRVKSIIHKYSNYVGFPVNVNGKQANEISAIWARDKANITEEEYGNFYRFVAGAFDEPMLRLHFKTDAPIDLKALLFVPSFHSEKMGMGRMKHGVSLYSRKVLLEANSDKLLPEWMRFVKGVVDSEDLPISLSRETMQDQRLLVNIKRALTRRVIGLFSSEAKKNPENYNEKIFPEYGNFLKEGAATDFENQREIGKLLRFHSSEVADNKLTSLDEYISRCDVAQDKIYYLTAPSREAALASPYYEVFKDANVEVLFLYNTIDDFVMSTLGQYNERRFVAAESGDVDLSELTKNRKDDAEKKDAPEDKTAAEVLPELEKVESEALQDWFKTELDDVLLKVSASTRLRNSPAIVVDHESAALRRMMRMVQQGRDGTDGANDMPKQQLEINLKHPIVHKINDYRKTDVELARALARQVYDNALIAAGLVEDPRMMLPRLNKLLEELLKK